MAEQASINLSGLPKALESISVTDGQATGINTIVAEFNKQVPYTKISQDTAWTAYAPTLGGTGVAIGNGTISGRYVRVGRHITVVVKLILGLTTTFGTAGAVTISLPVTTGADAGMFFEGAAHSVDVSDSNKKYIGACYADGGGASVMQVAGHAASWWSVSVPFAWTNLDEWYCQLTYESAS